MPRWRRYEAPPIPLCVLLLPAKLERSAVRERAEALMESPGVVAVEPPAMRLPELMRSVLAAGQVRRMRLPGRPRAVVVFDTTQYPLALALLAEHPEAELWYAGTGPGEMHAAATTRAALIFSADPPPEPMSELNRPLYERMEALGIESGRLGSERLR